MKTFFFSFIFLTTIAVLNHLFPQTGINEIDIQQYEYEKDLNEGIDSINKKIKLQSTPKPIKTKIKASPLAPLKNFGGNGYDVNKVKDWNDVVLLAALINSECRGCIQEEREVVAQVIRNRVEHNFDSNGSTYYDQISVSGQFSGFKKGNSTGHLFYYKGAYKIKVAKKIFYTDDVDTFIKNYNSMDNEKISFEDLEIERDHISIENYRIAYKVIHKGFKTIPDNVFYFCNSRIATNKREVARQRRNKVNLNEFFPANIIAQFGHDIFAYGKI